MTVEPAVRAGDSYLVQADHVEIKPSQRMLATASIGTWFGASVTHEYPTAPAGGLARRKVLLGWPAVGT